MDEKIVKEFLESRHDAVSGMDAEAIKGHYAFKVRFSQVNLKGLMEIGNYKDVMKRANALEQYGKDYKEKVLERFIWVDKDQMKAIVETRTQEVWLFKKEYDDLLLEIVTQMEIELINQIPQIVINHRRVITHTVLEDRHGMGWFDIIDGVNQGIPAH